ncbi:MAG: RNase stability modulator [Paenibacillus sp.]|nr:RNase stability modulator [Paenibacillus sp.]
MFRLDSEELEHIKYHWKRSRIGLVYLDIIHFNEWEQGRGRAYCEHVLSTIKTCTLKLQAQNPSIFKVCSMSDDFLFFVALNRKQSEERQTKDLLEMAIRIKLEIERTMLPSVRQKETDLSLELRMGTSLLSDQLETDMDTVIYRAVKQSIGMARQQEDSNASSKVNEFLDIMEKQLISSVYQPIVSFEDARIFGYEALTRGPSDSIFHSPVSLFEFAERENMLYTLDRLAREKAIAGCIELQDSEKVFINIPAHVIHDPHFTPGQTLKLLEARGLKPQNVVFEITERSSIEDFSTTKKLLQHYRSQGYQIAIDDAGAGYSSLQAIAELQPDFIKVDRSLIQDIHKDKIKENILETFVSFAEKMNIRIIAEGIEKTEELMKLMQMGIHFGQGYLIAKPSKQMISMDKSLTEQILRQRRWKSSNGRMTIGQLATPITSFEPDTYISEVANYFKGNERAIGAVIVSRGVPKGLIMRDKLFQQLAGQYGISLYWSRPISQLMDQYPLIVDEKISLDQVSQMATSRDINQLYDYVIITSEGQYLGTASIRSILESITKARVEYARVANPLTGLPGNVQIQRELSKRLLEGSAFSVIYADLDFFKWFNDRYGFHKGDQMIQFTADVLQEASRTCGHSFDFVGHIGGDDFIVLTDVEFPNRLCEEIIRQFDQGVIAFYEAESHEVVDREGRITDAEGVSISLSLVVCTCYADLNAEQISQEAAKLKKQAKAYKGSIYLYKHLNEYGDESLPLKYQEA